MSNPIWGKWGEPATIITYGDSGVGKSTDMFYSFPTALFLALPGAAKPARSVVGFDVWWSEVGSLDDAIGQVSSINQLPINQRPIAVVVDDLTLLAERQTMIMKASGAYPMQGDGVFRFWGDLRHKIQTLALFTRGIGAFPVFNGHRFTPRQDKDGWWKGGPELPSKKLVKAIPHAADVVYKAQTDSAYKGQNFWHGVYVCEPGDPDYHMKDRHDYKGTLPMNLGELLRGAGYNIPRPRGLEWMEQLADRVADERSRDEPITDIVNRYKTSLTGKVHPLHIRWALRDGFDRHTIKVIREESIFAI